MSTVPEVLTAIASIGQATLPNSQTVNGDLTSVTSTQGRLFLVGDEDFEIEREYDALAGASATEHYVVPCATVSDLQTTEQSVADAQVWADFEAMEAAVGNNPTLGLSGSFSLNATVIDITFRRLADQNGRHSLVRFGVDVYAASD